MPSRARPDAQTIDPATGNATPAPDLSAAFAAQRIAQEDLTASPADTRTGNAAYERGTMRALPRFDLVKPV